MISSIILLIVSAFFTSFLAKTPLIIGINILLISLLLTWSFARLFRTWYSFLIFLVYLGGILVIFAYFVAITPNQPISFGLNIVMLIISFLIIIIITYSLKQTLPISKFNELQVSAIFSNIYIPALILLIILLLLTIVFIVKLTNRRSGPLRPFIYV